MPDQHRHFWLPVFVGSMVGYGSNGTIFRMCARCGVVEVALGG